MAVYLYTGRLTDFGESPFPGDYPRLSVHPQRDAFSPDGPAAAKRIPIFPGVDGWFGVELIASVDLLPPTSYTLRCEWLAAEGEPPLGWAQWDFTAQIGGGSIATMTTKITRVWYATTPPPVNRAGIYWVHPITGDVKEWS